MTRGYPATKSSHRKRKNKIKNKTKAEMREEALRYAFLKVLLRSPLKEVKFSKGYDKVTIKFFDNEFSYRIVVKREVNVGDWGRKRDEIYLDKEISSKETMNSFKALCVHEAVEKILVEKFGLRVDDEAHVVANKKERSYLKKIGGNWKSHQLTVYHLWNKLDRH